VQSASTVHALPSGNGPQWSVPVQWPEAQSLSRLHTSSGPRTPQVPVSHMLRQSELEPWLAQTPEAHSLSAAHGFPFGWTPHVDRASSHTVVHSASLEQGAPSG
jgi:hypothetical protein